jgi:hypothetical protein
MIHAPAYHRISTGVGTILAASDAEDERCGRGFQIAAHVDERAVETSLDAKDGWPGGFEPAEVVRACRAAASWGTVR